MKKVDKITAISLAVASMGMLIDMEGSSVDERMARYVALIMCVVVVVKRFAPLWLGKNR